MKITKAYLKQIIKEELQKEFLGFGSKKQKDPRKDPNLAPLIDKIGRIHSDGMNNYADGYYSNDSAAFDTTDLQNQLVQKMKASGYSEDEIARLMRQFNPEYRSSI